MSTKKLQIIGNFGGSLIEIDDTLAKAGQAADAKATGDAINRMQANIDEVAGLVGGSSVEHTHDSRYYTEAEIDNMMATKVDAVDGMGLSTEDYTTAEKDKLATIEPDANFYEHPEHTSHASGLYKVTVDDSGHVSSATLADMEDIVALGIPAQDTTYDTEISDLSDRIDGVEDGINTTNQTLEGVSQELKSYKKTNNEAVSTNASGIEDNKTAIKEIKGDYLKSTDKTQLQDEIAKVSENVDANASVIEVLNGDKTVAGSVKQSIDNAFNEFAANVTNDNVVNTYKELIDYAATHGPEFTELVGKVDTINAHVGEVEADLSGYKTTVSEQFAEIDTTINSHVTNADNPHGVTKEQVGLADVDNTSDLDKPISYATQGALDSKADFEVLDAHTSNMDNPHEVTKEQIGLENVDNTSDAEKPISDATQEALNGKANLEHEHNSLYYTKDEILESITVEDIDDICEFNQSFGGDLVSVATEEWVQKNYQLKGNYLTEVPADYATKEFVENNAEPIGALRMELLWQNGQPDSHFPAQTIDVDLTEYDAIMVDTVTTPGTVIVRKGGTSALSLIVVSSTETNATVIQLARRLVSASASNGVIFQDAMSSLYTTARGAFNDVASSNSVAVPYRIYGIKGVN